MGKFVPVGYKKTVTHYDHRIEITKKESGRYDVVVRSVNTGGWTGLVNDFKHIHAAERAGKDAVHTAFGIPRRFKGKRATQHNQKQNRKK